MAPLKIETASIPNMPFYGIPRRESRDEDDIIYKMFSKSIFFGEFQHRVSSQYRVTSIRFSIGLSLIMSVCFSLSFAKRCC